MLVKPVTADDIDVYMPYMSSEEIYGCFSGRFIVMGASEESPDQPAGFCVLEILPEYIQIHRIFVNAGEDGKLVFTQLLEKIKDMPGEDKLPIYILGSHMGEKIKALGFVADDRRLYYEITRLSDMKAIPFKKRSGMKVVFAEDLSEKLSEKLQHADRDRFFQFPYDDFDPEIFGASLACLKDGEITAYLLVEENDKFVTIRKIYAADRESLDACFCALKLSTSENYPPDVQLVFLSTPRSGNWDLERYFDHIQKVPIQIMKLI